MENKHQYRIKSQSAIDLGENVATKPDNQREQEKRDFESGIAASLLQKIGMDNVIENQDPPNPDILIPSSNIGIELVRYIRKTDSAKDEGSISKFIRKCEEKYRAEGGELNAHIWIWPRSINNFHKRTRVEQNSLLDEIVQFALDNDAGNFDFSDIQDQRQFNGIIKEIELFEDKYRKYWQIPSAGIISFFPSIIKDAIAQKEMKIENYTRKHDELWLLIHSTNGCCIGSPNSQDMFCSTFKIEDEAKEIKHSGKFDRIFLLDFFNNVLELEKGV